MKNLKKIICVLLGAALLMSTLAPAAFAEDGYAGMNTDKVLAIEAFHTSVFPADTLCVALSGEYVSAGESIEISVCTVSAEGQLETVHTYGGDEMLIQYPCAENGNRLELYLRSESVTEYDSDYVLCIAEGSFMSTAGGNERIEYIADSLHLASIQLQDNSGDKDGGYDQGTVLSVVFINDYWISYYFENHGGITLTFDNEDIVSASDDGSFTLSDAGTTKVTVKLNDFVYEEIEVESFTAFKTYLNNLGIAFTSILDGPYGLAFIVGALFLPLSFITSPIVFVASIPLFLLNFVTSLFGVSIINILSQ